MNGTELASKYQGISMAETFRAKVLDFNRITIPQLIARALKIKKHSEVIIHIEKVI